MFKVWLRINITANQAIDKGILEYSRGKTTAGTGGRGCSTVI